MVNILSHYKNGNVDVTIYKDGTKVREYEDAPEPLHPESMDVKITNFCDLGCKYCHESSTTKGKHADLVKLKEKLKNLPAGVELALGGGNPLSHPELSEFLLWCKDRGLICNLTVNQGHLKKYKAELMKMLKEELIMGLGISITGDDYTEIRELKEISNNIVYHVIAGVQEPSILDTLMEIGNCKVLILGYKTFGRGVSYFSDDVTKKIQAWDGEIIKYLGKCLISFDNLALDQLDIQSKLPKVMWDSFYMGDDFTFTMYIDAVNEEYAPTSRSDSRTSFNSGSIEEYFTKNRIK